MDEFYSSILWHATSDAPIVSEFTGQRWAISDHLGPTRVLTAVPPPAGRQALLRLPIRTQIERP
jgi:hypothetical protein